MSHFDQAYAEELLPKSIKRLITVSSGHDNGANNCTASKFSNSMRHNSTTRALDNIAGHLKAKDEDVVILEAGQPWIAGHGDEGFLTTGCGQNDLQNSQNTVGRWNERVWGPQFDKLKTRNYGILSINSCHTGAGEDGADLLFALAVRSGHAVRARTGFSYCGSNGLTYQSGSTWQTATPRTRPHPILAPQHLFEAPKDMKIMADNKSFKAVSIDSVVRVEITKSYTLTGSKILHNLKDEDARGLLRLIDFESPFKPGGVPSAFVSAELLVKFADDKETPRTFVIYNYRIAQDTLFPEVFYYVASGFKTLLEKIG